MRRVLIVADDPHTRAWMSQSVASLDVSTRDVGLGELDAAIDEGEVDLAIADGGRRPDGLIQQVERATAHGSDIKLLIVVEREALGSLRMPVRLGSDFMVRGGSSDELSARVRALMWPGEEAVAQELVRVDTLTLNLATYQAHVATEPIDFTYLEYALFAFLVTHPNRAYGREMLLRRVWGADYYGGPRTVDVHIRRIRSKIGPELSRRLETVRNVGYLWHG